MKPRLRILLIEDDPDYAALVRMHLEACGAQVDLDLRHAVRLGEGLASARRTPFDAVLLDLMLPDSQGLPTLDAARAELGTTPIVVLTNLRYEDAGLEAVARGAQDFLLKERIDSANLLRALRFALERSRSLAQLEGVIRAAYDGMIVVDPAGKVRYGNPAAGALLGTTDGALVGSRLDLPIEPTEGRQLRLPGPAGGEPRLVEMRVRPVEWGGAEARLVTLRDLTEIQRVEGLKAEMRERRRLDQVKDQFLANVSHELRSPLMVAHGALRILDRGMAGPLNDGQRRMASVGVRNSARLVRIVENLLDLSRLESGLAAVRPQVFDAAEAAREALEEIGLIEDAQGKRLDLQAPAEGLLAFADRDMSMQVLHNLLNNALRHSRSSVRLLVSAEGGAIRFTVRDDGPGLPPDGTEKLFDRYVQVNRRERRGYGGTGLGLSICREILRANGGRIWAENAPEGGALFHFTLPTVPAGAGSRREPGGDHAAQA